MLTVGCHNMQNKEWAYRVSRRKRRLSDGETGDTSDADVHSGRAYQWIAVGCFRGSGASCVIALTDTQLHLYTLENVCGDTITHLVCEQAVAGRPASLATVPHDDQDLAALLFADGVLALLRFNTVTKRFEVVDRRVALTQVELPCLLTVMHVGGAVLASSWAGVHSLCYIKESKIQVQQEFQATHDDYVRHYPIVACGILDLCNRHGPSQDENLWPYSTSRDVLENILDKYALFNIHATAAAPNFPVDLLFLRNRGRWMAFYFTNYNNNTDTEESMSPVVWEMEEDPTCGIPTTSCWNIGTGSKPGLTVQAAIKAGHSLKTPELLYVDATGGIYSWQLDLTPRDLELYVSHVERECSGSPQGDEQGAAPEPAAVDASLDAPGADEVAVGRSAFHPSVLELYKIVNNKHTGVVHNVKGLKRGNLGTTIMELVAINQDTIMCLTSFHDCVILKLEPPLPSGTPRQYHLIHKILGTGLVVDSLLCDLPTGTGHQQLVTLCHTRDKTIPGEHFTLDHVLHVGEEAYPNCTTTSPPMAMEANSSCPSSTASAICSMTPYPRPEVVYDSGPGEVAGVTGVWCLKAHPQDVEHSMVLLSFIAGSRLLAIDGGVFHDVTDAMALDSSSPTLAAGNLDGESRLIAQVTPFAVKILPAALPGQDAMLPGRNSTSASAASSSGQEAVWRPEGGKSISVATVSPNGVGLHCSNSNEIIFLTCPNTSTPTEPLSIGVAARVDVGAEVSCISAACRHPASNEKDTWVLAIGTYAPSLVVIQFSTSVKRGIKPRQLYHCPVSAPDIFPWKPPAPSASSSAGAGAGPSGWGPHLKGPPVPESVLLGVDTQQQESSGGDSYLHVSLTVTLRTGELLQLSLGSSPMNDASSTLQVVAPPSSRSLGRLPATLLDLPSVSGGQTGSLLCHAVAVASDIVIKVCVKQWQGDCVVKVQPLQLHQVMKAAPLVLKRPDFNNIVGDIETSTPEDLMDLATSQSQLPASSETKVGGQEQHSSRPELFLFCCTTDGGFQLVSIDDAHLDTHHRAPLDTIKYGVCLSEGPVQGQVMVGGSITVPGDQNHPEYLRFPRPFPALAGIDVATGGSVGVMPQGTLDETITALSRLPLDLPLPLPKPFTTSSNTGTSSGRSTFYVMGSHVVKVRHDSSEEDEQVFDPVMDFERGGRLLILQHQVEGLDVDGEIEPGNGERAALNLQSTSIKVLGGLDLSQRVSTLALLHLDDEHPPNSLEGFRILAGIGTRLACFRITQAINGKLLVQRTTWAPLNFRAVTITVENRLNILVTDMNEGVTRFIHVTAYNSRDLLLMDRSDAQCRPCTAAASVSRGRMPDPSRTVVASIDVNGDLALLTPQYEKEERSLRPIGMFNTGDIGVSMLRSCFGMTPASCQRGVVAVTLGGQVLEIRPVKPHVGKALASLQHALAAHPYTRGIESKIGASKSRGSQRPSGPRSMYRHPMPKELPASPLLPGGAPSIEKKDEEQQGQGPSGSDTIKAGNKKQHIDDVNVLMETPSTPPSISDVAASDLCLDNGDNVDQGACVLDGKLLHQYLELPLAVQQEVMAAAGLADVLDGKSARGMARALHDVLVAQDFADCG